ncbi:glycosyltransferase [Aquimarina sp. ERC-38]|uniref:glycosyltransferase n=1 Tax=Aquimarina sp. ERC-38 TaxID=2949996 RepID=UPI0022469AC8|nr:glycosyltransferase [Aquimarina sp. ERC-38]UZO80239.1 glycosyltransferase [Aquimarina sp. ERC-38]
MKIIQFITTLAAGGAEKLVVDTSIKFQNLGHIVSLLILKKTNSPFEKILEDNTNISVHYLGTNLNIYNPILSFKLNKFFKNYDIVHVHLFPTLYWAALSKFFNPNRTYKLVFTEHNTTNKRRSNFILKYLDKIIYPRYDLIITISNAVDESLKIYLKSLNKPPYIRKVYNGIDLDIINKAKSYDKSIINITEVNTAILQVSSFTIQKDQTTLIRAFALLPDSYYLFFAGKGKTMENCKKLVKELEISDRVVFLGVRKDIPELLKTVDIVVLSSHFEGLSLSSVEGLASGNPFLASDVPGLTEVVEEAGILFPDQDHKTLYEAIIKLSTNKEYKDEVIQKCLKRASRFDINTMVYNYNQLYLEIKN